MKVIIQKTGKNAKKFRNAKIGLTLLYLHGEKKVDFYANEKPEYQTSKS